MGHRTCRFFRDLWDHILADKLVTGHHRKHMEHISQSMDKPEFRLDLKVRVARVQKCYNKDMKKVFFWINDMEVRVAIIDYFVLKGASLKQGKVPIGGLEKTIQDLLDKFGDEELA